MMKFLILNLFLTTKFRISLIKDFYHLFLALLFLTLTKKTLLNYITIHFQKILDFVSKYGESYHHLCMKSLHEISNTNKNKMLDFESYIIITDFNVVNISGLSL